MKAFPEMIDVVPQRSKTEKFPAPRGSRIGRALRMTLVMAMVACGGKATPEATARPDGMHQGSDQHEMGHMGQMGEMGEMGEMAAMPPQVAKFHETLAPRWHAPQGPQRMTDTCGAIGQFHADADAIVAAPAPNGANAAAWSEGGKQLAEAVTALDATCQGKDAAAFEPAFARVHKSFHHLMEAASTHAHEHEHDHGHDHGEHKM